MAALPGHEVEADRARLRPLGPDPMAIGFLGVLRHEPFQLALGLLMLDEGWSRWQYTAANSAQELDVLMSTVRTASMRGRGGSTPKRRGGSPVLTQRQNFFSAVSRRCW